MHVQEKIVVTQSPSKFISIAGLFEDVFVAVSKFIRCNLLKVSEYKNIKKKKKLINKVQLTEEQKKEIRDFYKIHYGKKMSNNWHRLYQSYTGIYQYNYFF